MVAADGSAEFGGEMETAAGSRCDPTDRADRRG